MLEHHAAIVEQAPRLRSKVTNGKTLFATGGDMRGAWARRLRDLIGQHLSDLGGPDMASTAEASIIRRAATLTVELERLEAKFAEAGQAEANDLDLYQRTAGNLRRLLEAVGIERRAREVPNLDDYIASHAPAPKEIAAEASGSAQDGPDDVGSMDEADEAPDAVAPEGDDDA
jgi:hypothetical protein